MGKMKRDVLGWSWLTQTGFVTALLVALLQAGCEGSNGIRTSNDQYATDRVRVGSNTFINDGTSMVYFTGAVNRRRSFGIEPKTVVSCTYNQSEMRYEVNLYQPGEGQQLRSRDYGAAEGVFLKFGRGEAPEVVRRMNDATRSQVYAVVNTPRNQDAGFHRLRGSECEFSAQRRTVQGVDRLAGDVACRMMQNNARQMVSIQGNFDCRIRVISN